MNNKIQIRQAGLVTQVNQAIAGVLTYAEPIGLTLVTHDAMTDKLVDFITGTTTSTQQKTTLSARRATLRINLKTALDYLAAARDMLKMILGRQYSPSWFELGYFGSLTLPRSEEKVVQFLQALIAYLTTHPERENAALNITAARTTSILDDLIAARNAVNNQLTTVQLALSTRNASGKELRNMLSALLKELSVRLNPLDERWLAFGFNKPGAVQTPEVPQNVTATLMGTNKVAVQWTSAPRADHYRVWVKVNGVDEELLAVGSPADLDFTIEGLPANTKVEVAVSSVNSGGESVKSTIVTVTTP